ncbi:plasmid pRiA4b ORF-3 family protein, partial [Candidatus Bipolaricaulota bacterium]|nr:plasmid pRiA4b ORF-3 family protein [Candidatus Bipolaricaulota bacterium]
MSQEFSTAYIFKIELKDFNPTIWRRIQVPEDYTFWEL